MAVKNSKEITISKKTISWFEDRVGHSLSQSDLLEIQTSLVHLGRAIAHYQKLHPEVKNVR